MQSRDRYSEGISIKSTPIHNKKHYECNRLVFQRIGLDHTVIDSCVDIMTMVGRGSSKHGATRGTRGGGWGGGIEPDSAEQPRDYLSLTGGDQISSL